jgi:predicted lipoprotein with Yx(FWY)xxD motif
VDNALALAVAGCSNGSGGSIDPVPAPPANGAPVSAQPTSLGTILVDGKAHTVYHFANDKDATSTCTGACAANWPAVTGKLGSTTRDDGTRQLTVASHPVYTFVRDSSPGDTNGQGQVLDGGLWTVVSPAGAPLADATPVATTQVPAGPAY